MRDAQIEIIRQGGASVELSGAPPRQALDVLEKWQRKAARS